MEPCCYGIIGIGGWGGWHLEAVRRLQGEGLARLQAVAEAHPATCRRELEELKEAGVHIYEDHRQMLQRESGLEVVSVPTPIPLHLPMTLDCLEAGANVLLEKPPAVRVQEVDALRDGVRETGRRVQVGFQHITDPTAGELKGLLGQGRIGRVREMVVVGTWRRLRSYYERSPWAGRLRLGDRWVLDGPLNNPLVHFIHEALYLASSEPFGTLRPLSVRAELYRAHPIEGEDLVCARAELEGGAVLWTYLTLCAPESSPPRVEITGTRGRALWRPGHYELEGDGEGLEGESDGGSTREVMRNFILSLRGSQPQCCPPEQSRNVILHNNGCYLSSGAIRPLPDRAVQRYRVEREGAEDVATEVRGVVELIEEAARGRRLFSQMDLQWAEATQEVELDFESFDPSFLLGGG